MAYPDWKRTVPLPPAVWLVRHASEPFPRQVPIADLYASLTFPRGAGTLPYLAVNMVMTQNGEATVRGKATTIGTAVDGLVLTRVRAAADALLSGSGTLVHDDVVAALPEDATRRRVAEGRPTRLVAAVVSSSLSFGEEVFARRFFVDQRFDKLVVTGPAAPLDRIRAVERHGAQVVTVAAAANDGRPSIVAVLEALAARGIHTVVCEGGPRFLPGLFAARAVREYFLTTSPMFTGDPDAPRPVQGLFASGGAPVFLSSISRYEHAFQDPGTGARLIEAFDRFHVAYAP